MSETSRKTAGRHQSPDADGARRIAFLPFGKLIDEWRWGVFSGEISPDNYNKAWWDLRTKYQGIAPAVERTRSRLRPGRQVPRPANVPYTRYFLARILQFQFQRSLCDTAGYDGDLHVLHLWQQGSWATSSTPCSRPAQSQPWQDTLESLTGTREMDATAIIDYFAPLMEYLKEQNAGRSCGW